MSIALDPFCIAVPFAMLFSAALSVATSVGGCEWLIYTRAVHMNVAFWQFSNNPPNFASVADVMTFLIIMNYTCAGPFYGGFDCIIVLDFGTRKNILPIYFVPLFMRYGMHLNIYG